MSYFPASGLAIAPSQITGSTAFGRAVLVLTGANSSVLTTNGSALPALLAQGQLAMEFLAGGVGVVNNSFDPNSLTNMNFTWGVLNSTT